MIGAVLVLSALVTSLGSTSESASAWRLGNCPPAVLDAQKDAVAAIRAAGPDEVNWVPHPFSAEAGEIVENFIARHRIAFADTPEESLPAGDRTLFDLAARKQLHWSVARVTDWTNVACGYGPHGEYWLVRLFDNKTGREVTRVAVAPSGLVETLQHYPANGPHVSSPLSPNTVPRDFQGRPVEIEKGSSQLVALSGTIRCSHLDPCVAWRSVSGVVIQSRESLVLAPENGESIDFRDESVRGSLHTTIQSLRDQGFDVVGLGGDLARAGRAIGPGVGSRSR